MPEEPVYPKIEMGKWNRFHADLPPKLVELLVKNDSWGKAVESTKRWSLIIEPLRMFYRPVFYSRMTIGGGIEIVDISDRPNARHPESLTWLVAGSPVAGQTPQQWASSVDITGLDAGRALSNLALHAFESIKRIPVNNVLPLHRRS